MNKIALSNSNTITLRSPKVRDIRAVSHIEEDQEREFTLFCNLTGLTPEEMDDLDYGDYVKIQDVYMGLAFPSGASS